MSENSNNKEIRNKLKIKGKEYQDKNTNKFKQLRNGYRILKKKKSKKNPYKILGLNKNSNINTIQLELNKKIKETWKKLLKSAPNKNKKNLANKYKNLENLRLTLIEKIKNQLKIKLSYLKWGGNSCWIDTLVLATLIDEKSTFLDTELGKILEKKI